MRALTWQGIEKVEVTEVADPVIEEPTDAIIKVTSTAICGSDLHLYGVLGPYLSAGDVLGHESMGIVEAVGAEVTHIQPGDRVVLPNDRIRQKNPQRVPGVPLAPSWSHVFD